MVKQHDLKALLDYITAVNDVLIQIDEKARSDGFDLGINQVIKVADKSYPTILEHFQNYNWKSGVDCPYFWPEPYRTWPLDVPIQEAAGFVFGYGETMGMWYVKHHNGKVFGYDIDDDKPEYFIASSDLGFLKAMAIFMNFEASNKVSPTAVTEKMRLEGVAQCVRVAGLESEAYFKFIFAV